MGPHLWRTRKAALPNLDVNLKLKNKKASSILKGNIVFNDCRASDGLQMMGKSNQQMIVIRKICLEQQRNQDIAKPGTLASYLTSKVLKNEKTQQNEILLALALLEAHSTLRGTELASITRKEVTVGTDCVKIIVSKRKAKNGGRQIILRPRLDKTICPYAALSKQIEMFNNRFSNQNSVSLNKIILQSSDQGVSALL
ncbi:MAG: hypothetical protein EZS28_011855 [Streblomastix strix]|uniref:Uncharacterized protein n=1 Tax=Streblomastix strix TaxID=222440 RepID=A0A5J4WD44_9EUKA|nr:MAG: hypothetical protein EZS28_011855 [Streblomastix strix]